MLWNVTQFTLLSSQLFIDTSVGYRNWVHCPLSMLNHVRTTWRSCVRAMWIRNIFHNLWFYCFHSLINNLECIGNLAFPPSLFSIQTMCLFIFPLWSLSLPVWTFILQDAVLCHKILEIHCPELLHLTHKKCLTYLVPFPISSDSHVKLTFAAFSLYLNCKHQRLMAPWKFYYNCSKFVWLNSGLPWQTTANLTTNTLTGVTAGNASFWTLLESSNGIIYSAHHLQKNVSRVKKEELIFRKQKVKQTKCKGMTFLRISACEKS